MQALDVVDEIFLARLCSGGAAPAARCALRARGKREEGIPLHTTVAHIRSDEVPFGTDVYLSRAGRGGDGMSGMGEWITL